ncbi:MAG: fasciclin domain-containing protein [Nocardioides sp.]|nr:fasciclin domain-containing protein [Nocardioides sp.]
MSVRSITAVSALALALTAVAPVATASAHAAPGERSLAQVLTSDGNTFDRNAKDFDIVTEAALAVLAAKPDSPVGILADGTKRATVFAPTDRAFRLLVKDLTGKTIWREKRIFNTLVGVAGVDTIEQVLLYHVVPGKTLTSGKVLRADGVAVTTAAGLPITVKVRKHPLQIRLIDRDRNDRNPHVVLRAIDLNKGNKQVAHGIDRVLRPVDL